MDHDEVVLYASVDHLFSLALCFSLLIPRKHKLHDIKGLVEEQVLAGFAYAYGTVLKQHQTQVDEKSHLKVNLTYCDKVKGWQSVNPKVLGAKNYYHTLQQAAIAYNLKKGYRVLKFTLPPVISTLPIPFTDKQRQAMDPPTALKYISLFKRMWNSPIQVDEWTRSPSTWRHTPCKVVLSSQACFSAPIKTIALNRSATTLFLNQQGSMKKRDAVKHVVERFLLPGVEELGLNEASLSTWMTRIQNVLKLKDELELEVPLYKLVPMEGACVGFE